MGRMVVSRGSASKLEGESGSCFVKDWHATVLLAKIVGGAICVSRQDCFGNFRDEGYRSGGKGQSSRWKSGTGSFGFSEFGRRNPPQTSGGGGDGLHRVKRGLLVENNLMYVSFFCGSRVSKCTRKELYITQANCHSKEWPGLGGVVRLIVQLLVHPVAHQVHRKRTQRLRQKAV